MPQLDTGEGFIALKRKAVPVPRGADCLRWWLRRLNFEGVADEDCDEDGFPEDCGNGLLDCDVEDEKMLDGSDFRQGDEVCMLRAQVDG